MTIWIHGFFTMLISKDILNVEPLAYELWPTGGGNKLRFMGSCPERDNEGQ